MPRSTPATRSGTDDNQTVRYEYTDGLRTEIIADVPSGGTDQETTYTYGTTLANSDVATSTLKRAETYPDSVDNDDRITFSAVGPAVPDADSHSTFNTSRGRHSRPYTGTRPRTTNTEGKRQEQKMTKRNTFELSLSGVAMMLLAMPATAADQLPDPYGT